MRPGNVTAYRLQPEKAAPVLGVLAILLAVILLLPFLLRALIPAATGETEPVQLSSFDSYDEIPLTLDGQPVRCEFNDESPLMWGYDCGGVSLDSVVHPRESVQDPEATLRRMFRAGSWASADDSLAVQHFGDTLVLDDPGYGLIGILTPIEDNFLMYVQIDVLWDSEDTADYGEAVWQTLIGESMPESLLGTLTTSGYAPEETTL
ncbi:hypothetical protein [Corynebacterium doosanense]|uniref:Uncharacterized protein n=1 Tax=Corynebacterium doosanense CAU 212 = DSM 45436 TaxID=558173 RepID=A0A097IJ62_9CORY|nr:hypothetical protein [Corynebacterium doosanense]AIT62148.1 hypothetical protein CDOO_01120 [Corynebacterium doosanense CAU 212 = DSM 45436]